MALAAIRPTSATAAAPSAKGAVRSSSSSGNFTISSGASSANSAGGGVQITNGDSSAPIKIPECRRLVQLQDRGRRPITAVTAPPSPTTERPRSPVDYKSKMEDLAVEVCGENGAYYKVGFCKKYRQ